MSVALLRRSLVALAAVLFASGTARAQDRKLRIMSTDSVPIPYAYLSLEGGHAQISDESGIISMGPGKKQTFVLEVRRIGYAPYFGKVELPDTAITITIALTTLAQQLTQVKVNSGKSKSSLELSGFYQRWLNGQRGTLSAAFIGPEEIEKKNSSRISALLGTQSGIRMGRTSSGQSVVMSSAGGCAMAVILDGRQVCPTIGCHMQAGQISDGNSVLIDEIIDISSVAAIEVYKRGGNMPSDFHVDSECGAVAIWSGGRKR